MNGKSEQPNVSAVKDPDVIEKLDQVLAGPNDRAFVVCAHDTCKLNVKGHCTIFTVQDVPRMKGSGPCNRYEPRSEVT